MNIARWLLVAIPGAYSLLRAISETPPDPRFLAATYTNSMLTFIQTKLAMVRLPSPPHPSHLIRSISRLIARALPKK